MCAEPLESRCILAAVGGLFLVGCFVSACWLAHTWRCLGPIQLSRVRLRPPPWPGSQ